MGSLQDDLRAVPGWTSAVEKLMAQPDVSATELLAGLDAQAATHLFSAVKATLAGTGLHEKLGKGEELLAPVLVQNIYQGCIAKTDATLVLRY